VRKSLTVKSVATGAVAMSNAGIWLRERREELHLSRSGVERLTGASASKAADERYGSGVAASLTLRRAGAPRTSLKWRVSVSATK
jgi:hypothetical protein